MEIKGLRTLSDFLIIAGGVTLYVVLRFKISPSVRGFFCDDESIRYIYHGESITETILLLLVYFIGLLLIINTEFILGRNSLRETYLSGFLVPDWIASAYSISVDYVVVSLFVQILTNAAKLIVGSLRPTFIESCHPNIDLTNCSQYNNSYITDFKCQTPLNDNLRKSFFSGHASLSAYTAVFCFQYIQVKWKVDRSSILRLWKHVVQGILVAGFSCIILSRYMENVHHPIDLIVGTFVGAVIGIFTVKNVSKLSARDPVEINAESLPLLCSNSVIDFRLPATSSCESVKV